LIYRPKGSVKSSIGFTHRHTPFIARKRANAIRFVFFTPVA
jgi:hypothetical protein